MNILKNKKLLIIIGVVLVVLIAGISIFFYIKSLKDETDKLNNRVEEIEEKESKKKKEEPFDLPDKYYKESKVEKLDLDGLNKLIDNKESFALYVFLPGCSSCAEFKVVLDEFQEDNKLTFYSTEIANAQKTELNDKIKFAPSFVIYRKGKIVAYLDAESNHDKDYYKNVDNFKGWLTKYINLK